MATVDSVERYLMEDFDQEELRIAGLINEAAFLESQHTKKAESLRLEKEVLDKEANALRKRVMEITHQTNAMQTKILDETRAAREARRQIDLRKQELEQQKKNKEVYEELYKKSSELDFIVNNSFWNKDALPHQIEGAKRLAIAGSGILGDTMGLGKTFTSLIWSDLLEAKRLLVITPNDVVSNFVDEIRMWTPHRKSLTYMSQMTKSMRRTMVGILKELDEYVVVVNYEAWRKDMQLIRDYIDLQFDAIILDEAHVLKERKSLTYKAVKQLVYAANKCSNCGSRDVTDSICNMCGTEPTVFDEFCSIKHVLPMTGTPILNKPQDLFSLLTLVDRVHFNSEYDFLSNYCERNNYTKRWGFQSGGLPRLTRRISSYFVSRNAKQAGIDMPAPKPQTYYLDCDEELYPKQAEVLRQLNEYAAIVMGEDKVVGINAMIALITRKRQAVSWPAGIVIRDPEGVELLRCDARESVKIDKIIKLDPTDGEWEGLLPDITQEGQRDVQNPNKFLGERVIVFSQFKEVLKEIERRCKEANIPACRLDGESDIEDRAKIKEDFNRRYSDAENYHQEYAVVLANYKTGGVGLNLTGATHTILADADWNPGKENQAIARNNRIGQTGETHLHILEVRSTVDVWMRKLIQEKGNLIAGFNTEFDLASELRKALENGEF